MGKCLTIPGHVKEISATSAFCEYAPRAGNCSQRLFDLVTDLLDLIQVGTLDLKAHGRANPRGEHLNAATDGHRPVVGEAGNLQGLVHLPH